MAENSKLKGELEQKKDELKQKEAELRLAVAAEYSNIPTDALALNILAGLRSSADSHITKTEEIDIQFREKTEQASASSSDLRSSGVSALEDTQPAQESTLEEGTASFCKGCI